MTDTADANDSDDDEPGYGTTRVPYPVWKRANETRIERDESWAEFFERGIHAGPVAKLTESEIRRIVREEIAENDDRTREIAREVVDEMVVDEAQRR